MALKKSYIGVELRLGVFNVIKLAQLVRCSLMVREVASLIPSGAVFAHMNIELA